MDIRQIKLKGFMSYQQEAVFDFSEQSIWVLSGVNGSGNGTRESGIWVIEAYSYWHAVNDELSGKLQLAQMDVDEVHIEEADADYAGLA